MGVNATEMSIVLGVAALVNLILLIALCHTWAFWRQVKWYVAMLTAGNWLEMIFTFAVYLGWDISGTWQGTAGSCKFLMFTYWLGPNLATMATAALALHVLMTVMTGQQGEGRPLRHALVVGLFVLLALPLPLAMIPIHQLVPIPGHPEGGQQCVSFLSFNTVQEAHIFLLGNIIAVVFFPLLVSIVCWLLAGCLFFCREKSVELKGEASSTDLVISGMQALLLLVCCVPYYTLYLLAVFHARSGFEMSVKMMTAVTYLSHCRNILSAIVTVAFSYLGVYRHYGFYSCAGDDRSSSGERQRLVQ